MRLHTPYGQLDAEVEAFDLPPTFPIILPICRELGIAEVVDRFCPMHHWEHVTHGQVIEFLILHILQAPHRLPLYKLEEWADEYHVNRLYDCNPSAFNDDRVGRALEVLALCLREVEVELVTRALKLYEVPIGAIHWDLTHVTFAGAHEQCPLVCSGYGDGQMHDKQVHVSLHISSEHGLPLRHETLPGNAQQAPLAPSYLADLRERLPSSDLLIVSDCSGISYDNIELYEGAQARFLGPLQLTSDERELLAEAPAEAFVPLEYRSQSAPLCRYSCFDTTLTIERQKRAKPLVVRALYLHSTGKQERDAQQRQKRLDKTLRRLKQINGYLNRNRYVKADYARDQIQKAIPAELRNIVHYTLQGPDKHLRLDYHVDQEALKRAGRADGRWMLVTNWWEASPEELFVLYRRQSTIEARFRNFNSELSVHPLWLQHEDRICALLMVFVMALMVYSILQLCSERAGLEGDHYPKMTARQIIYHFHAVKIVQVTIRGHPPQRELFLSDKQSRILSRLGFPDPNKYLRKRPPSQMPPYGGD